MLTPGQVSESLKVPPSTLRRWAVRFVNHLSPQPKGRVHRQYNVDDLNTFRRIRDLSGQGFTLEEIEKQLDVVDQNPPPDDTTDIITVEGYTQVLDYAVQTLGSIQTMVADQGKRITQLESQAAAADQVTIKSQDDEIKRLRQWAAQPWYKRIFSKPPKES